VTTQTLFFLNVVTNAQQNLQPPLASEEDVWKAQMHAQKKPHFGPVDFEEIPIYNQERAVVEQMTACSLIGSPESVEFQLKQLRERVHFDEIMAVSYIFDEQKQAQSISTSSNAFFTSTCCAKSAVNFSLFSALYSSESANWFSISASLEAYLFIFSSN
jgi:hypothetical protein